MRISSLSLRRAAVGASVVLLAGSLLGACSKPAGHGTEAKPAPPAGSAGTGVWPGPKPSAVSAARAELAALTVAQARPMTGYSRDRFPHWASQGQSCDTRETVLKRDGQSVVADAQCKPTSGTWVSPYDGLTFTAANKLDIDHVVPLAAAWRAGADSWTDDQRKALANDLSRPQLLAVSAASNRSKGDQTPDQWKPPSQSAWCSYAKAWTDVKAYYKLAVTDAEKAALGQMLDTCPAGS
ncbi:HNH endonuclease family protein [Kitasatospora sp. NPDC088160]|uniref:HNH endonuclease family protein n=1 Tax=Kitasatospora sp. NPDC088160 TaxID=3364072 RepID=UPI0037FCE7D2